MRSRFYVYRHIRLDTNTPFYVGKGSGDRAFFSYKRNSYWKNIVKKCGYRAEIVRYFDNEQECFEFESTLIKLYKIFNFCESNFTDGGEGISGYSHTSEAKNKISEAQKLIIDRKFSNETRSRMSKVHSGKFKSKNMKRKISGTLNGKFIGMIITPYGMFESLNQASIKTNTPYTTLRRWCKDPNNKLWRIYSE